MAKRHALLIGISRYGEGLEPIPSALLDVEKMAEVLLDRELGGIEEVNLQVLRDPERTELASSIESFYADKESDDFLLLYFSGHGFRDDDRQLLLSSAESRKVQPDGKARVQRATTLSAAEVRGFMERSRCKRQVVILDCCFSGAFAEGLMAKDEGAMEIEEMLGGKGRAILTSSDAIETSRAPEAGDGLSVYTRYLVEGIQTGAADRQRRGWLDPEDLHFYAKSRVLEVAPSMTPQFFPTRDGHSIRVCRVRRDPGVAYRRKVQELAEKRKGKISPAGREILAELAKELKLTAEIAGQIEAEVLQPFRDYEAKLARYSGVAKATLEAAGSKSEGLSSQDREELKELEQQLKLHPQDVSNIHIKLRIDEKEVVEDPDPTPFSAQASSPKKANSLGQVRGYSRSRGRASSISDGGSDGVRSYSQSWSSSTSDTDGVPTVSPASPVAPDTIIPAGGAAGKLRIYELSRDLGLDNKDVLDAAEKLSIAAKSHSSSISDEEAARIRTLIQFQSPLSVSPTSSNGSTLIQIDNESGFLIRNGDKWAVKTKSISISGFEEELAPGVALRMLQIPAGSFLMGSPESEEERTRAEGPQHVVYMPAFYLGQTQVTQAQWRVVSSWQKINRDLTPQPSFFRGANRPVEMVRWEDAIEFCLRLRKRTQRQYTLPSEAQWEYACRAGTTSPFAFGETLTSELANFNGLKTYGSGPQGIHRNKTTEVSLYPANPWGLNEMHGNVFEWCLDRWHGSYEGVPEDGSAWLCDGESGSRVIRGGSWNSSPNRCRSASRRRWQQGTFYSNIGFRICLTEQGFLDSPF